MRNPADNQRDYALQMVTGRVVNRDWMGNGGVLPPCVELAVTLKHRVNKTCELLVGR